MNDKPERDDAILKIIHKNTCEPILGREEQCTGELSGVNVKEA